MKSQQRTNCLKVVAILLVITLLCPTVFKGISIEAHAENEQNIATETIVTGIANAEEISLVSMSEVPDFISQDQVEEFGHISRLTDEEALNTLVYLNRDGTKTKYIMDYPVKYLDESGNAQFIDLSLTEMPNAFTTTENDILLSVAKDYTNGITLAYNNHSVTLVTMPVSNSSFGNISTAPIVTATTANNTVTYNDVFGEGIDVRYTPLHNGVKEDIILEAYSNVSTFNFILNTGGLGVYSENGYYYLATAEDADMRMDLGKIVVYDSAFKMSEGTMEVTSIKEGQLYQLTISVDTEFLSDSNTVYPVRIDPSITISDTTHGAGAVTDCPVYSGKPTLNMGSALYNPIGYLDSTYQTGRTAVKLTGLINDSTYQSLNTNGILSAYFYIKDSSGTAAKTVNLYALTSNSTWTETSLTWNTVGTISSTLQTSSSVGSGAWSSFNITALVKSWKNGTYNINCGFILQSANESTAGNFFSSESAETNWPYLILSYTDTGSGGGDSFSTASTISMSSNPQVNTVISGEKRYYKFIPSETAEYVFFSSRITGDPKIWLYNSSLEQIGYNDDSAGQSNFRLAASLTANTTYYLELGHYGTNSGQYSFFILKDANIGNGSYYFQNLYSSQYLDIEGPVAQEILHQWNFSYGNQAKWSVVKQSDGYYTIQSLYGDKKYVGISSTSTGADNIILSSSISDNTKWKILIDNSNRLVLEARGALGRAMYTPTTSLGDRLQLLYITYHGNSSTSGSHWRPIEFTYNYSVNHYYDNGFDVRFSTGASELPEYQRVVSNALLQIFGLSTNVNGIQGYVSAADSCLGTPVTVTHTTTACTHSETHKTRTSLKDHMGDLYGFGNSTTVKAIWTGHDLVDNRAVSFSAAYTIVIPPYSTSRAGRIYSLMHETSHQLGATDHYCFGDGTNGCTNLDCWYCYSTYSTVPTCIMDVWDLEIESKLLEGDLSSIYCEICLSNTHKDGIFRHLNDHH